MSLKVILHVDLDAFFAAVEEREHPEYRGKPLVVGADPKEGFGRGVVSTCNYKARRFGIRSGMPISRAWKLCKEAVFIPVNMRLYTEVSDRIMDVLRSFADRFEQTSIDEAFLDVSMKARDFKTALKLAKEIKKKILVGEGLTCSIGIGPNKLVAKIASDFQKPDGLTLVEEKDVKHFLAPLQVDKLPGIGNKTKNRLNAMGVNTIGELASYDVVKLRDEFGVLGPEFYQMAQGIDHAEIVEERRPKSFSREHTFEVDTIDKELISSTLDNLLEDVIKDVRDNSYRFKTLTIKIRYEDFETHTHSKTIPFPSNSKALKDFAFKLLKPFLRSGKSIRLVGVKASNLVSQEKQKILLE